MWVGHLLELLAEIVPLICSGALAAEGAAVLTQHPPYTETQVSLLIVPADR